MFKWINLLISLIITYKYYNVKVYILKRMILYYNTYILTVKILIFINLTQLFAF